jgi:hypothetical protein
MSFNFLFGLNPHQLELESDAINKHKMRALLMLNKGSDTEVLLFTGAWPFLMTNVAKWREEAEELGLLDYSTRELPELPDPRIVKMFRNSNNIEIIISLRARCRTESREYRNVSVYLLEAWRRKTQKEKAQ